MSTVQIWGSRLMTDFALARHNMVESQVRTNRVTDDRLLAAMSELEREMFVPEQQRSVAYVDEDIPVAPGRYIMEPMVLARLLQAADAGPDDLALEIGCGTGYGTALLARLCGAVVALDSEIGLVETATGLLAELGIDNAAVIKGALVAGYAKQAPYDVILLGGAVANIPDTIFDQLADGGRLLAVVSENQGLGKAALFLRRGGVISNRILFDAAIPMLPGFEKPEKFKF